jgi:hypothetical protein
LNTKRRRNAGRQLEEFITTATIHNSGGSGVGGHKLEVYSHGRDSDAGQTRKTVSSLSTVTDLEATLPPLTKSHFKTGTIIITLSLALTGRPQVSSFPAAQTRFLPGRVAESGPTRSRVRLGVGDSRLSGPGPGLAQWY